MKKQPILITGGAGFVGTNLAANLVMEGYPVRILDNLSRRGVEKNLQWLRRAYADLIEFRHEDIRDAVEVERAVRGSRMVYHFAAQVAVTTSLADPIEDFEINVRGTLNVLEAIRAQSSRPGLLFTSTNKVYGALDDLPIEEDGLRCKAKGDAGISEDRPLDFHSPYGCSKGAADQYVRDYSRSYGISSVVFRMSCIYGPHQFGTEDQGWVAHFLIRALEGEPIVIYGDGRQVRDILYVDDLVRALRIPLERMDAVAGQVFNIGGGARNTVSLLELIDRIEDLTGTRPQVAFAEEREGDQRYFVSDSSRLRNCAEWKPNINIEEGLPRLLRWVKANRKAPLPVAAGMA